MRTGAGIYSFAAMVRVVNVSTSAAVAAVRGSRVNAIPPSATGADRTIVR
ncbi:hypothetical protein [Amycolatopsis sp. cmx-4-61]